MFDYAGLFTDDEAAALEAAIVEFQQETGYDFAILVTVEDYGYDDYQLLCDDFTAAQGLGLGMNNSSILCYLDLYSDGYYYISAYGDLAYLMNTEDIMLLADTGMEYFYNGEFSSGFTWTMDMLTMALGEIGVMNTKRVYDYIGLFDDDEIQTLEAAIAEFRALSGMDFLYLSTYEEMAGNEDGVYMEEFYLNHGFGEGDHKSGAMVYLDLDAETLYFDYYVQNFGDMDGIVSQDDLTAIVGNVGELMGEGDILAAVLAILDDYSAYFQ